MTTLLFVHGTGVRQPSYGETLGEVTRQVSQRWPEIRVEGIYWGGTLGVRLRCDGGSIPTYSKTRAVGAPDESDRRAALWDVLYDDPLFELRVLGEAQGAKPAFRANELSPGETIRSALDALRPWPKLEQLLMQAHIPQDTFFAAVRWVVLDVEFQKAIRTTVIDVNEMRNATARAVVARALVMLHDARPPDDCGLIVPDGAICDRLVDELAGKLLPGTRSFGGKVFNMLAGFALKLGAMNPVRRRRGSLSDLSLPAIGDILWYQVRGAALRRLLAEKITGLVQAATAVGQPENVVVLAHSLGGIAAVDLLIERRLPVALLATVGSQAPLFYEMGVLHALECPLQLPPHFPPWLNIYDLNDFLSYVGNRVFSGRTDDVRVDNHQPFPAAHSAYWTNEEVWQALENQMRKAKLL